MAIDDKVVPTKSDEQNLKITPIQPKLVIYSRKKQKKRQKTRDLQNKPLNQTKLLRSCPLLYYYTKVNVNINFINFLMER